MSWDIYLVVTVDGNDITVGDFNYTHNTNQMIREAGFIDWNMDFLNQDEYRASMLADALEPVIHELRTNRAKYDAMNPENGWGSRETLVKVLDDLYLTCRKFPSAEIYSSF